MTPDLKRLKDKHRALLVERAQVELDHVQIRCRLEKCQEELEESYLIRTDVIDRLHEAEQQLRKVEE